jgi:hypothetical protein
MRTLIMSLSLGIFAAPLLAGEPHSITEAELRDLSNAEYIALISDAGDKNLDYTPDEIASGLRRHYQERKARFIDVGFKVLRDPCS